MFVRAIILFYTLFIIVVHGTHFLGGTITWRPLNASATGTPVAIVITQTYLFNYAVMQCTNAMILNNSFVPNYAGLASGKLVCVTNCGSGAVGYTNISVIPHCTDFSIPGITIFGQRSDTVYLQSNDDFSASFISQAWRPLATVSSGGWAISTRINVVPRSDNGLYNNAPVATMMSPIFIPYNKPMTIQIPVADADGDPMRCRWATNANGVDECNSVCPPTSLPPNTVIYSNCTIVITGRNISDWYAVTLQVEDFINSTSTTPLSSVPVQFLVQVVNASSCSTPPEIIGIPPEESCTPVLVGQTFSSQLIAINSCGPSVSILDISTLSFAGDIQSNITELNYTTYYKSFSWTPTLAQLGYQVMCALAFDSQNSQSAQYCFKFYVSENTTSGCPGVITTTIPTSTTSSTSTTTDMNSSVSPIGSMTDMTSFELIEISSAAAAPITTMMDTSSTTTASSTSSTSTVATSILTSSISTTIPNQENLINWPLIGSIIGLIALVALILGSCVCWYYLCPFTGLVCGNTNGKPVLYHIEQCTDPDCYLPDRASSLGISSPPYLNYFAGNTPDTPISGYINIERLSSITETNRIWSPRNSERNHRFSFSSLNPSSHIPLVPISVSKIRMNDIEGTIGNPFIKPPNREEDEEQIHVLNQLKTTNNVRVSRIKSTNKQKISADIALNKIDTNETSVQVTRVRSSSLNVPHEPSLNESCPPKLDDTTIYLDDCDESKTVSNPSKDNSNDVQLHRLSRKSEYSSQIDHVEITPDTLQPNPSVISANSHIRVDRVLTGKYQVRTRSTAPLSFIIGMIQKKRSNHCRVKRISRKNTV